MRGLERSGARRSALAAAQAPRKGLSVATAGPGARAGKAAPRPWRQAAEIAYPISSSLLVNDTEPTGE